MSYFGPDPGDVDFCPVCGLELWPFPVGDHKSCEEILERREKTRELALATAAIDPGYPLQDLPF